MIVPRRELSLLQLVDLLVDRSERLIVRSTEVSSARDVSDLLHRGLIEVDRHIAHDRTERGLYGIGCLTSPRAYADRVDRYTEGLRQISRHLRGDIPRIVGTIRQQDDDLTLGLAILEAADSRGESRADSRLVSDDTRRHLPKAINEGRMVLRQRTSREALTSEDDEADIIIRAIGDEAHSDLLGSLDAIGLEVHRQHTRRDIHSEHNVDPLDTILAP